MSEHDLFMKKITSLIAQSGLTKEEDIKKFIEDNLMGKNMDDMMGEEDSKSDEEMALSFVSQAYNEVEIYEKISLIELALDYDENCLEAYLLLSQCVLHPYLSKYFLEKGIKNGKKMFPKKFLKENKESLYFMQDVRPFLKLYDALGQVYLLDGNYFESIIIFEKLLKINPTDNLNVKEYLGLQYLIIEEFEDYKQLSEQYKDSKDISLYYNDVYYTFTHEQNGLKAKQLLEKAKEYNKHVIKKLLSPKTKLQVNDNYAIGSNEEASNYYFYAHALWQENEEIINWLKQNQ